MPFELEKMNVFVARDDDWISAPPDNEREVALIPIRDARERGKIQRARAVFPRAAIVALVPQNADGLGLDALRDGAHATAPIGAVESELSLSVGLAVARKSAEDARVAKLEDAISVLTHELRNPLNVASMTLAVLADHEDLPPEKHAAYLAKVQRAVDRMTVLLEEACDLSRVETGKLALDLQPLSVAELVADAERAARGIAEERGVKIACAPCDDRVLADRARATKALAAAVSGVVASAPRNAGAIVRVEAAADGADVAFLITGGGRAKVGRGLVFSLSRAARLLEAQGGRAWTAPDLESSPTLRFTLPRPR